MNNIKNIILACLIVVLCAVKVAHTQEHCTARNTKALVNTYNTVTLHDSYLNANPKYALTLWDTRDLEYSTNTHSPAKFHHPDWTIEKLGNLYFSEFDHHGNIFLSASGLSSGRFGEWFPVHTFGSLGGSGAIYKLDAVSGAPSVWTVLPQEGNDTGDSGLGGITYDRSTNSMYVVNMFNGTIYQLNASDAALKSTYRPDPRVLGVTSGNIADFQAKPFGLDIYKERLYYTVWDATSPVNANSSGATQGSLVVRSVAINPNTGVMDPSSDTEEINFFFDDAFSNNGCAMSADIDFRNDGKMAIGSFSNCVSYLLNISNGSFLHNHSAADYVFKKVAGNWSPEVISSVGHCVYETGDACNLEKDGSATGGMAWNTYPYDQDKLFMSGGDLHAETSKWGVVGYDLETLKDTPHTRESSMKFSQFIYDTSIFDDNNADAKGNGGDVDVFNCVKVGNYVWFDTDKDGIQDSNEAPVPNITMHLFDAITDTLLATTTTNSDGEYYFMTQPEGKYRIEIDVASFNSGAPLNGFVLTSLNSTTDDLDNDGILVASVPTILAMGPDLSNGDSPEDFSFDFGFYESICGDNHLDPGETCDDNNTIGGDGCSATCQLEGCGNSVEDEGEACDDGNTVGGDGCSADCTKIEICGDSIIDTGEVCDDGNNTSGDGCNADCSKIEICGDSLIDEGEACDDGNTVGGDGCSTDCTKIEVCGDSIIDTGEVCDDGNTTSGDGCNATCQEERCGNSILDAGEACDDGNTVSGDGCINNCSKEEICGDGVLDSGEACDDGNTVPADGCSPICTEDNSISDVCDPSIGGMSACCTQHAQTEDLQELDNAIKELATRSNSVFRIIRSSLRKKGLITKKIVKSLKGLSTKNEEEGLFAWGILWTHPVDGIQSPADIFSCEKPTLSCVPVDFSTDEASYDKSLKIIMNRTNKALKKYSSRLSVKANNKAKKKIKKMTKLRKRLATDSKKIIRSGYSCRN